MSRDIILRPLYVETETVTAVNPAGYEVEVPIAFWIVLASLEEPGQLRGKTPMPAVVQTLLQGELNDINRVYLTVGEMIAKLDGRLQAIVIEEGEDGYLGKIRISRSEGEAVFEMEVGFTDAICFSIASGSSLMMDRVAFLNRRESSYLLTDEDLPVC